MRQIDADALIERWTANGDYANCIYDGAFVVKTIDEAPTVEPERKKGTWIRDEFGVRCDRCGLYAYRDRFDVPWESDFCPYCGADMRGEQE